MDSTNIRSLRTLTADQIEQLANAILDDHGPGLTQTQFNDVMLALLEDIAGFEVISQRRLGRILRTMWSVYRQL